MQVVVKCCVQDSKVLIGGAKMQNITAPDRFNENVVDRKCLISDKDTCARLGRPPCDVTIVVDTLDVAAHPTGSFGCQLHAAWHE
jgi:hypothetical protein